MPRLYLGIDQSYSGFATVAYAPAAGTVTEHVLDFSPAKAGHGPQRLHHAHHALEQHFQTLAKAGEVRQVAFEGYAYGAQFKREELGELGGILRLALIEVFPPHMLHTVAPMSVKKYATGSGRSPKDRVMLEVYKRWGYEAATNDLADAYTLARISADLDREEPPCLKFQAEVIRTIRSPKKTAA